MAARRKKTASALPVAPASVALAPPAENGRTLSRQAEIETKLEIDPDGKVPSFTGRRKLVEAGIVAASDPQTYQLDATYYDTEQLDLLRSKVTLRRRTGGKDAGWHLKLPSVQGARTEVGLPLSAGDLGDVPPELCGLVRGAARGRNLLPVARIQNERTVRELLDTSGVPLIEVADDHVKATPLLPGGPGPARWRELEAEIIHGNSGQLEATVDVLMSAGARRASSASKLARSLGHEPPPARRAKSAGEVIIGSLGRQRDYLITADRGLREGAEGALAQARSSVQRIAAMLAVYSPLLAGADPVALRDALGDMVDVLDESWQVQQGERRLCAQLNEEPEAYAGAARSRLHDACDRRLAAARTRIGEFIDSEPYLHLLRRLDELVAQPPLSRRGRRSASAELPALIGAGWEQLRDLADAALADPDNLAAVQQVRLSARTVRYAAEAAIGALGADAAVLASGLEEVQETLGELHEARAAANLLAQLAVEEATDGVAGFAFGRLHAFEEALAHGAFDEFSDAWDRVEDGELVAALEG